MSTKTALITGITGQDGSYLTDLLLGKGYKVHGIIRRSSSFNTARIDHAYTHPNLALHYGDSTDSDSLSRIIRLTKPHEVYNLAAQSHVAVSFEMPVYTAQAVAIGTINLLEAVREAQQMQGHEIRVYQAGSSEMFGSAPPPQSEATAFHPRSPYGCGKVFAHHTAVNYREAYGLHVSNGILFNHESPRRGETFVTRKVTRAVGRIVYGLQDTVTLGNLDARRDWGFAGDYVDAMWRMVQLDQPDDYVIATGEMHSVRYLVETAFGSVGLNWTDHVRIDERYRRPAEVDALCGDASKARAALGWSPSVDFAGLVRMMVDHDLKLAAREKAVAA